MHTVQLTGDNPNNRFNINHSSTLLKLKGFTLYYHALTIDTPIYTERFGYYETKIGNDAYFIRIERSNDGDIVAMLHFHNSKLVKELVAADSVYSSIFIKENQLIYNEYTIPGLIYKLLVEANLVEDVFTEQDKKINWDTPITKLSTDLSRFK